MGMEGGRAGPHTCGPFMLATDGATLAKNGT